ncbi:MAG: iron ABC transporter permease, partial [Chromatiales bacterium]|nr:iron ABC transporter permease [Chromatiales bacterium]
MSTTFPAHGPMLAGSMRPRLALDGWTIVAATIGILVAIPVGSVLITALGPSDGIWSHLVSTVLGTYVGNTLWLMAGVAIGTIVIGTSTAWLVTMYRFPGRRILSW